MKSLTKLDVPSPASCLEFFCNELQTANNVTANVLLGTASLLKKFREKGKLDPEEVARLMLAANKVRDAGARPAEAAAVFFCIYTCQLKKDGNEKELGDVLSDETPKSKLEAGLEKLPDEAVGGQDLLAKILNELGLSAVQTHINMKRGNN